MKKGFKIARVIGLSALLVLTAYLLYGVIGSLYVWQKQPLFVSADASSRSHGFLVVGCFYAAFLLLALSIDFLYWYFLFLRPKKRAKLLQTGKENA